MSVAESEVLIAAPPEEVWALISDLERGPEWSVVTLECRLTSDRPPGLGCTYRSVSRFAASKISTEHEIVEWVPPGGWSPGASKAEGLPSYRPANLRERELC